MMFIFISGFFGALFTALCVLLVASDSISNWILGFIFGALAFISWFIFAALISNSRGKKKTTQYMEAGAKGKELVDQIISETKAANVINSQRFAGDGLKMIIVTDDGKGGNEWPVIITKDCIYEDWVSSFAIPTNTKIVFSRGQEGEVTRYKKMDVRKSASFGYMVGGVGAAAYNASKALETNAAGGLAYSCKTGRFPVNVASSGAFATVKYAIVANNVLASLPDNQKQNDFGDIVSEGKYFTIFKISTYAGGYALGMASNYNELFNHIIRNHTS